MGMNEPTITTGQPIRLLAASSNLVRYFNKEWPSYPENPLLNELARSGSDLFSTSEAPISNQDLQDVDLNEVVVEMEISGLPVDSSSHSGGMATGASSGTAPCEAASPL